MLTRHGFHTRPLCAGTKKAPAEKRGLELGFCGRRDVVSQMPEGNDSFSEIALADIHGGLLSDILVVGK